MRILASCPLPAELARDGAGRPFAQELAPAARSARELSLALARHRPDVLLLHDTAVCSREVLAAWRERAGRGAFLALGLPRGGRRAFGALADGLELETFAIDGVGEAAFREAERVFARASCDVLRRARRGPPGEVLLVGAGVVNAVTAFVLQQAGHRVVLLDQGPDPRSALGAEHPGATAGGANARMYSLTESDCHRAQAERAAGATAFDTPIARGGWLALPEDALEPDDQDWLAAFAAVPAWLARGYSRELQSLVARSGVLWDAWQIAQPALFAGAELRQGLLRTYSHWDRFKESEALHEQHGVLVETLSPEFLLRRHPAFAAAAREPGLCGALQVRGFTLQIHDFMRGLLDRLEAEGGRTEWQTRALGVERAPDGEIRALVTDRGRRTAAHYVLSPGACGGALEREFPYLAQIRGVLGVWTEAPQASAGLRCSAKLRREGRAPEDVNVAVGRGPGGRPWLRCSGGLGYVGRRPQAAAPEQLELLHAQLHEVVREQLLDVIPDPAPRSCVRPWTPSGLGLFAVEPVQGGGACVVTGGHNTGGFAMAPVIAEAVAEALAGREHPMHELFHPERSARTLGARERRAAAL